MAFFLFLLQVPANAEASRNTKFSTDLVLQHASSQPVKAIRAYKDGLLNENQGQLFFNLEQVKIQASKVEDFQLNYLLVDKQDFYTASSLGIFQNYRQIFSKEECTALHMASKSIFISCQNGIYQAEFDKKNKFQNFHWQIMPNSPNQLSYFTLNKSKSNPNYATGPRGFYVYNPYKKSWQVSNFGLSRNFQNEYGLGRYLVHSTKEEEIIYLPSAGGLMISKDGAKTWSKSNNGIEGDADGFYTIREIVEFSDYYFLIASTGLYYRQDDQLTWTKLSLNNSQKDEHLNENFYAIEIFDDSLYVANSQGAVYRIEERLIETVSLEQKSNTDFVLDFLRLEPQIQQVHKRALEFSGIPSGESFDKYRRQARWRNVLPDFQTYIERDNLNYISIETEGSDNFTASTGALDSSFDRNDIERNNTAINAGVRLNWSLGDLVFDPEVNDINTSARITANLRENILTEVTQLYFRRKELITEVLSSEELKIDYKLELDQLLAQLDARTGAWYSKELENNLKDLDLNSKLKEFYYET